jgi:hypothetical protein
MFKWSLWGIVDALFSTILGYKPRYTYQKYWQALSVVYANSIFLDLQELKDKAMSRHRPVGQW